MEKELRGDKLFKFNIIFCIMNLKNQFKGVLYEIWRKRDS